MYRSVFFIEKEFVRQSCWSNYGRLSREMGFWQGRTLLERSFSGFASFSTIVRLWVCWAKEEIWRPNDCFTGWLLLMELPSLCWILHMTQMKQLLPLQRIGVMDRGLTAQSVKGLLVLKWWRVEGLAELWAIPEIEADPLCKLDTRVAKYTVRALAMMYKHTFKYKRRYSYCC